MNRTIYCSPHHLTMHGPNASFGNHILHLLFCLNVAEKTGISLGISCDSNLDALFDLSEYKRPHPPSIVRYFSEEYGGTATEYAEKEKRNLENSRNLLLCDSGKLPEHFYVEGWFQHNSTLPEQSVFDRLKIHGKILNFISDECEDIHRDDSISLHYRGTDFRSVSHGWGDCRLGLDYYDSCFRELEKSPHIKQINVFTDEPTILEDLKRLTSLKFNLMSNSYWIDWACLLLSKNLISSNSSFAFSAGKYNKNLVFQPRNFLLRGKPESICFPVDPYYEKSVIL